MPTYEYECLKCKKEFELFQRITDEPRKRCPDCRGKVRRKISSGGGILFKGSGFYQTDYRSESYKKSAAADKKTSSGGDSPSKEAGSKDAGSSSKKKDA